MKTFRAPRPSCTLALTALSLLTTLNPARLFADDPRAAHFWISTSNVATTGPPATASEVPVVNSAIGNSHSLYIWGQPALVNPNLPFSASNPFKQLLDFSLNLSTYDSNFSFLDNSILVYNPVVTGTKRFEYVYDFSQGLTATQTSLDPPYQVRGIAGYTILGNNIGIGGSNCGSDPNCTMTSSGPAWLIASVAESTLTDAGTAEYFLQVGQNGILHAGANESVANTYVVLGARDGPVYNARNDREKKFGGESADFIIQVSAGLTGDYNGNGKVDASDYVVWRKNNGTNNVLANDNGLGVPIGTGHYNLWRANFGNPPDAGSGTSEGTVSNTAVVPEPATWLLLLVGAGFLATRRGVHARRFTPLLIALLLCTRSLAADVSSTWDGTTNNWSSNHWSSPNFPNNGNGGFTYDAIINSGTVALDQDITIQGLTLSGGTLTGSSSLTLSGASTWNDGTMSGSGQTTIGSGGTLSLNGGSIRYLQRLLVNNGTTTWTAGEFTMTNGTFQNNGSFTANSNGELYNYGLGSGGVFNNAGTFTKLGSGAMSSYWAYGTDSMVFNNTGMVNVQQGALRLEGGGTHTGDFSIAASSTLWLARTHSFSATSDITGSGTVNVFGGTTTFNGQLSSAGAWAISGGTTNFNSTTTGGSLNLSSGTLGGTGNVTFNGASSWTDGTMSGSGQTTIGSGGTLSLNGGSIRYLQRLLVNNGTTTWTAGEFTMTNGTFQNNGSFTANSNGELYNYGLGSGGVFNNAGTFTKLGSGAMSSYWAYGTDSMVFNNTGMVNVQQGALRLEGGGTHTGDFSIAASSTLWLARTHSFSATSDITGSGTVNVFGGTTTFNGQLSSGNTLVISGGTANVGSATIAGAINVVGGTANFNSTTTGGSLNLSSGTLGGTGNVTFNGASSWTDGTMSGSGQTTIGSGGTLSLNGGSIRYLQRLLVNNGTTTWTAGEFTMTNGTFQNNGSFTANSNGELYNYGLGSGGVFNNAGTFTKLGSGAMSSYWAYGTDSMVFNNTGMVNVQQGALRLEGGGTHTGDFSIAASSTLWLARTHSFSATSDITGSGTVNVFGGTTTFNGQLSSAGAWAISGGTTNFNSTTTGGSLNLSSGTLGGTGNVTFNGASSWTDGTMSGSGQTTIGSGGTLSLNGGSIRYLQRLLVNNGTTTWTAGEFTMTNGTFQNNGSFTANSNGELYNYGLGSGGVFNNAGTFTKLGSGAMSSYWAYGTDSMVFNNTGMVNVQQGALRLEGGGTHTGDFSIAASSTLWLARTHSFSATSDITGSGTVNVFGGTTTFNGQLSSAGAWAISGGTTNFNSTTTGGSLNLSSGTLGGTGNVTFNGASSWTDGTMSGSGQTTIGSGGTLSINAPGNSVSLNRSLVNNGATTWTAGNILMTGGTFTNNGGFTFNSASQLSANGWDASGGVDTFTNAGSFIKQGAGTALFRASGIGLAFNNSGTVDIQGGTLDLDWQGTHTGDFSIASGASLWLNGTHSFSATSDITGSGTVNVFGGTTTFNGQLSSAGAWAISGGTTNFNSTTTGGSLNLSSGTLGGTGNVTFNGASSWTDGTMSGSGQTTIGSGGTLSLNGGSIRYLQRLLVNNGTTTWTAGEFTMTNGTFQNNGSFTANSNGELYNYGLGSGGVFNNAGTFTKLGSGAMSSYWAYGTDSMVFNNTGMVNVQQGALRLEGGGTHTGDFSIAASSTLWLARTHSFSATSDITGSGTVNVFGGTTTFNGQLSSGNTLVISGGTANVGSATIAGAINVVGGTANFNSTTTGGSLNLSSGTLGGTGNVTFNGASSWTDGTMSGSGQTTIGSGGTLSLNGGSIRYLQRLLVNNGTTTWTAGEFTMTNGTFQNNGSFTANSNGELYNYGLGSGGVFNNAGTFTKLGSGAMSSYWAYGTDSMVFNNTGMVNVQQGALRLEGGGTHTGDFSIAASSTLWLARTHSFSATSDITGSGTVNVFGGTTTFNGQLSSAGAWAISGGTTNFNSTTTGGSLNLSSGTLGGTGNVTFNGASSWTDGTMSGSGQTTIGSGGSLSLGGGTHVLNRSLVNNGTTTWTDGWLEMTNGTFQNNGSFTANSNGDLLNYGIDNGGVFNNAGTFTKLGSGAMSSYWAYGTDSMVFNNTGMVNVQQGALRLEGGGTHTGDFSIAASSTLWLARTHSFSATSDITGSGTVNVVGGTTTFNGHVTAAGITNYEGAVLKGSGTYQANVMNAGRLAPGNSPGIITIDGDYTQTSTGVLEIEVGGLTPGTQHDQVIVSGSAALDGTFTFPIINGFQPQLNDEITFLTANSITGAPKNVFAPNLGSANPNLSFVVIKNTQDLKLRFVAPTDVHFVDNSGLTTQDWNQATKWDSGSVPDTADRVDLSRSQAPSVQRIDVTSSDASTHAITVHDQSSPITIAVDNDKTLAAAVGDITIGQNATIQLGTAGNPLNTGTLATSTSQSVVLEDGGILKGNGTVTAGDLTIADGIVAPGFSVGHIDVEGNYIQQSASTLLVDVQGTDGAQHDTIDVTGQAQLGGTIQVNATGFVLANPGQPIPILSAGSRNGVFDDVLTTGNPNIFFAPIYGTPGSGAGAPGSGASVDCGVATCIAGFLKGDMDRDGNEFLDAEDVQVFALALNNPLLYKLTYGISRNQPGDLDGDSLMTFDDIRHFKDLMSGSGMGSAQFDAVFNAAMSTVPEPSSGLTLIICTFCLLMFRQPRLRGFIFSSSRSQLARSMYGAEPNPRNVEAWA